MPRFATIERLPASPKTAAANDNSPTSIYAYSSEVENLLRRLQASDDREINSRSASEGRRLRGMALAAIVTVLAWCVPVGAPAIFLLPSENEQAQPTEDEPSARKGDRLTLPAS